MTTEFTLLLGTAATLGFVHTILGPDHYVPFIAMATARRWSVRKTILITLLSGVGHVTSSVIIGAVGLFFGIEVLKLSALESVRGEVAGWLLFGFGLAYTVWGLRRALKKRSTVTHAHGSLTHTHAAGHLTHSHTAEDGTRANITPWVLFTIFVFGPCEPLIPILMYPAARADVISVFAVALTFSLFTIGTMLTMVYLPLKGLARIQVRGLERYGHALAGLVVTLCGAGIQFFGL